MKKTIMVEKDVNICDFCGKEIDTWYTHTCKICGRDICNSCKHEIEISPYDEICLCHECKNIDISEYIQNQKKLNDSYDQRTELIYKGIAIIDKLREQYYARIQSNMED